MAVSVWYLWVLSFFFNFFSFESQAVSGLLDINDQKSEKSDGEYNTNEDSNDQTLVGSYSNNDTSLSTTLKQEKDTNHDSSILGLNDSEWRLFREIFEFYWKFGVFSETKYSDTRSLFT